MKWDCKYQLNHKLIALLNWHLFPWNCICICFMTNIKDKYDKYSNEICHWRLLYLTNDNDLLRTCQLQFTRVQHRCQMVFGIGKVTKVLSLNYAPETFPFVECASGNAPTISLGDTVGGSSDLIRRTIALNLHCRQFTNIWVRNMILDNTVINISIATSAEIDGPPVNHAYPRAFDARASFVNDARIPAQDSRALNA